jgi:hypothetical protein
MFSDRVLVYALQAQISWGYESLVADQNVRSKGWWFEAVLMDSVLQSVQGER